MGEIDKSWLPESEPLPGGGMRVHLPSEIEWLLAGGKIKKESKSMPAYNIKEGWREILNNWITRWQEKQNQPGKAPRAFIRAYDLLHRTEELGFGVDFISIKGIEGSLRDQNPGITKEEIQDAMKFIKPLLVETTLKYDVVELKGGEEEKQ